MIGLQSPHLQTGTWQSSAYSPVKEHVPRSYIPTTGIDYTVQKYSIQPKCGQTLDVYTVICDSGPSSYLPA